MELKESIWNACARLSGEGSNRSDADEVFAMFLKQSEDVQLPIIKEMLNTNRFAFMYKAWESLDIIVMRTTNVRQLGEFMKQFGDSGNEIKSLRQIKAMAFGKLVIRSLNSTEPIQEFIQYFGKHDLTVINGIFEIELWSQIMLLIEDQNFSPKILTFIKKYTCSSLVSRVIEIFNIFEVFNDDNLLNSFLEFARNSRQTLISYKENDNIHHHILNKICKCLEKRIFKFPDSCDIYIQRMANLLVEFINSNSENSDDFLHTTRTCTMIMNSSWNMVENFQNLKRADFGLQIIAAYSDKIVRMEMQKSHISHIPHILINSFNLRSSPDKRFFLPIIKSLRCVVEATGIGHEKLFDVLKFVFVEKSFKKEKYVDIAPEFWQQTCLALKCLLKTHFSYYIIQQCFQPCIYFIQQFSECSSIFKNIFETIRHLESDDSEVHWELVELSNELSRYIRNFNEYKPCFIDVIKMKTYISFAADKFTVRRGTGKASDISLFLEILEKHQICNLEVFNTSIAFIFDSVTKNRELISSCLIKASIYEHIKRVIPKVTMFERVPLFDILLKTKEKRQAINMCIDFVFEFDMVASPEIMDFHLEDQLGFNTDQPTKEQLQRRYGYRVCLEILKSVTKIKSPKYAPVLECFDELVRVQLIISQEWKTSKCMKQTDNSKHIGETGQQVENVDYSAAVTHFEKIGELAAQIIELQSAP